MKFSYKQLLLALTIFGSLQAHDFPSTTDLELAPEFWQTLGKEAQKAVGVENPVPIMISKEPIEENTAAYTNGKTIVINLPKLSRFSYGAKRSIFFHEAIHVKNKDLDQYKSRNISAHLKAGLGYIFIFTALKLIGLKKKHRDIGSTCSVLYLMYNAHKDLHAYDAFLERRADQEGLLATQCELCVRETGLYKEMEETDTKITTSRNKGYIWSKEAYAIADKLKHKRCTVHTNPVLAEQSVNFIKAGKETIAQIFSQK